MQATTPRRALGLDWWPLLAVIPALGALALAIWGLGAAKAYVVADPCISGWSVPWGGPFAILESAALLCAVLAWLIARLRRDDVLRAHAVVAVIAVLAVATVALVVNAAPFGWNC